ncbi:hypothetical protein G5714_021854 [Onychostoma macrolepis]|uniref:Uncharacterized protein n=1 Tax=Onychostoma macrolepis TaxID=369639 RepID=A0A7J6BSA4_9TELE|nr:hypothetical protein G5714_021854 [Onychostoma macrolepis]
MSSRHPITALSEFKMEEFEKAIIFLQDIIHLFRRMKVGLKGATSPKLHLPLLSQTKLILHLPSLSQEHHSSSHQQQHCSSTYQQPANITGHHDS